MKEIAELYGCEKSLDAVQEFRRSHGLEAITEMCFKAARISTVLIDDGLKLDKRHEISWHQNFIPCVGRILRVEDLAEKILAEVRYFFFSFGLLLHFFFFTFGYICIYVIELNRVMQQKQDGL